LVFVALPMARAKWFPEHTAYKLTAKGTDTLIYAGGIDKWSANALIEGINARPEVTRLVVSSTGGDVSAAVRVAKFISDRKLDLVVRSYCASSCFNYFTIAANSVLVEPDSLLIFHGTAATTAETAPGVLGPVTRRLLRKDIRNELAFLKQIGFDGAVFSKLNNHRNDYSKKNYPDATAWAVGRSFYSENKLPLAESSFFPADDNALNETVTKVLRQLRADEQDITELNLGADFR
jgi:hypothetical protein